MRSKLTSDAALTYPGSITHISEDQFFMVSQSNQLWIGKIDYWINNSEEKEKIVEASVLDIWESKRVKFSEFEQKILQFATLYGTEARSFLKLLPYNPCWIALKVMETMQVILRDLDVITQASGGDISSGLDSMYIPEWICRPISAEYKIMPINKVIDDFEMLVSAYKVSDDQDRQCHLCSILVN